MKKQNVVWTILFIIVLLSVGYSLFDQFVSKSSAGKRKSGGLERIKPSVSSNMVLVPGGVFLMGSDSSDVCDNEKPAHSVTLDSFYIGKYEVTQREWKAVMGNNPSEFKGDDLPVETISWYDAVEFCIKKSIKEGCRPCYTIDKSRKDHNNKSSDDSLKWKVKCDFSENGYRLPTEAEWEYVARFGKKNQDYRYSGSHDIESVGWYNGNAGDKTHPYGQKNSNELGIYDMSGNLSEWCWDWYDYDYYSKKIVKNPNGPKIGSTRITRGGSWRNGKKFANCRDRGGADHFNRYDNIGFRLVFIP